MYIEDNNKTTTLDEYDEWWAPVKDINRRNEKASNKPIIITSIALVTLLALTLWIFYLCNWHTVNDVEIVRWCTYADDTEYRYAKNLIKDFISDKTGHKPEKVVFWLSYGNTSWGTYNCTMYYLYEDTWYTKSYPYWLIPDSIDTALLNIIRD